MTNSFFLHGQKKHFGCFNKRTRFPAGLFVILTAGCLYAAMPVLSRLEMIGSGRGLALTLGADAPFAITIHDKTSPRADGSIVSITCSNVIYGLNDYTFNTLPAGCPVKQVLAKENKDGNSVELVIKVFAPLDKTIRSKRKDNRWVVLLTSAPVNDFAWAAQNEAEKRVETAATLGKPALAAVPEERISVEKTPSPAQHPVVPQVTASSFLEDITILHRERVEKVILKLDSPAEIIVKCTPGKILALFVNTKNGLSHATFKSEKDWLVKSIEINEVKHGGTMWLGASIIVNEQGGSRPIIQTLPDRLVLYSVRDTKQCLYLWSARTGTTLSYDFISPEQFPVDYTKIEKKVLTDSKNDFGAGGTFSVGGPSPAQANLTKKQTGPVSPVEPAVSSRPAVSSPVRAVRLVVIKDKVNLRSDPTAASNGNKVAQLSLGAIGTREEKKGQWVHVAFDDLRGWLLASMVMDSVKVSRTMWNKIEAYALEKKKLEEKKLQREEKAKAVAEARALAEEKAKAGKLARAQEQAAAAQVAKEAKKAKEQAAVEAAQQAQDVQKAKAEAAKNQKPRAQPTQELAKAPQASAKDSLQPAPVKTFPKLIEYHVLGRDPFLPLSQDEEGPLPNIENLQLVGILYDAMDRIGLFEDIRNKAKAFALRENDPVKNGYLLRIQTDKVLFLINELGISRTYAMKLYRGKEQ
jgi:hypothetical protein